MHPARSDAPVAVVLVGAAASVHIERWAAGLRSRGHHVSIVDLSGRRRGPMDRIVYLRELRSRVRAAARGRRSVINLHYVPSGWLALGLRGLHPIITSVWGGDITTVWPGIAGAWREAQLSRLLAAAEARTATSAYLRDTLQRRFGLLARVVPFGVETSVFKPAAKPSGGRLRIGYVKWLEHIYGPDILLSAFAEVSSVADAELAIIGDGSMEPSLRNQAAALGIADRVHFLGRRPHSSLPEILHTIDILAMPSRREAFGMSAVEASACGIPVVASRVGGVPEVVVHEETGLLVEPEDSEQFAAALLRLVEDAELRTALGRAGREFVIERFEWSRCLAAMEDVYRDALDS